MGMSAMNEKEWDSLHRGIINRLTVTVYRTASRARPEVRHVRMHGEDAVVKDYGRSGNIFKHLLGAFLSRREAAALRRAAGIPSVARVISLPRPWILVIEHIQGTRIAEADPELLTPEFFSHLSALIAQLHGRGIAHGDLEKLDNLLITPDGEPAIVDFAAAVMSGGNPLAALALPYLIENDRRAVYKAKSKLASHLLTDREHELLERRSGPERWFRRVREHVREPVKSLATGEDETRTP